MLHVPSLGVDDASPSFSPTGLIDSPTLDSDAAEDRRAAIECDGFDPLGLYALEVERDAAGTILADAFPGQTLSLSFSRTMIRIGGEWSSRVEWFAMAHVADVSATGATPTAAVQAVIKAHRKATAPVRSTPVHCGVDANTFEAFGRIDPATSVAFLERVNQQFGAPEFLTVGRDGRVMLISGRVGPQEATDIGVLIGEHNMTDADRAAEASIQILIEPRGEFFKARLVLASGERIDVFGVCLSESAARVWARTGILSLRSTILAPAVAVSGIAAA